MGDATMTPEKYRAINEWQMVVDGCEALVGMAWNGGGAFTCAEAEVIYDMILLVLGEEQANLFMYRHAQEDEPDDDHYASDSGYWHYRPHKED